jgi:hypothetical protein
MKYLKLITEPELPETLHITFMYFGKSVVKISTINDNLKDISQFKLFNPNDDLFSDIPVKKYSYGNSVDLTNLITATRFKLMQELGQDIVNQNFAQWTPHISIKDPSFVVPEVITVIGIKSNDNTFELKFNEILPASFPKIIGLCGAAYSGKDTAALAISELDPELSEIFAFAGPLKDACKSLFNFTHEQLYDQDLKEKVDDRFHKSPRQILQWLGTDILRNQINQDFFIMNMKQRIENSKANCIIISDVRFDNEAKFIKSLGGKIIKINRINGKTSEYSEHVTENGISSNLIDIIFYNDETLENFQKTIKNFIKLLE